MIAAIVIMSVPDPLNRFHEIKLNSAITYQIQLEFLDQKEKANFSKQAKNFGH